MTPKDGFSSSFGGGGCTGITPVTPSDDLTTDVADVNSIMASIFGNDEVMDHTVGAPTHSDAEEGAVNLDEETKSLIDDMFGPESVDFQPLFRKDEITQVPHNYHTEEDTTEHQRLLQWKYSSNFEDSPTIATTSSSGRYHAAINPSSFDDNQSFASTSTSGINVNKAMGRMSWSEWCFNATAYVRQPIWRMLVEKSWQLRYVITSCITTECENGKTSHVDGMKLVVGAMLCFMFYEGFFQAEKESQELSIQSGVTIPKMIGEAGRSHQVHFIDHAPSDTVLPGAIDTAFRDVDDLPLGIMDTPIYWHIPRSGGTTMKLILSMCMGRVVACEQGAGHQLDEQLEILNKPFGNFANVDTSTPLGLDRAAEMGLIPSRMVDVVLTPHILESTQLFDTHHKGRLFAMFRHPVERIVSLYYFLRMPDQRATVGLDIQDMTLAQFATDFSENWMVRALTGSMTVPIDDSHLQVAKEILRKKFLIGLLDQKTESLRRIEAYFGWTLPSRVAQTCKNNMFYFEPQSKNIHPELDPSDTSPETQHEYDVLVEHNLYDIKLYEYAKRLFEEQVLLIK